MAGRDAPQVNVRLPEELARRLKVMAFATGKAQVEIVTEALGAYLTILERRNNHSLYGGPRASMREEDVDKEGS